jgi:putative membrane protein
MEFKNKAIAPMVASILYTTATSAIAQVGEIPERFGQYNHGYDMMWGSNQWGGFGMVLGPIFMILVVVGTVASIIYLLRLFGAAGPATSSHEAHNRALVLLKDRYAKGEIDSTEFTERKKLLAD